MQISIPLASFLMASTAAAAISKVLPGPLAIQTCYDNETPDLHCYTGSDDTPQNVTIADVNYIAAYLRSYGRQVKEGRFFTQTTENAPDCAEWTLYARKSALAVAKHIDSSKSSSVLFEDIATTIDGGPSATEPQKQAAVVGCLAAGGSLGVKVNTANPAYHTDKYTKAGYSWDGILIKVVGNPA